MEYILRAYYGFVDGKMMVFMLVCIIERRNEGGHCGTEVSRDHGCKYDKSFAHQCTFQCFFVRRLVQNETTDMSEVCSVCDKS